MGQAQVYAYYAQQGWNKDGVDFNIFQVYSEDSTNHTAFDPTSIMEYAIPDSLTIGSYAIGWNTEFSPMDVEFMKRQYPKAAPAMTELTMGKRISADLATAGEVDEFHFGVASPHHHEHGGPDRHRAHAARPRRPRSADLGRRPRPGTNARIVRKLQPGDYWLTVRHKKAAATGSYSVGGEESGPDSAAPTRRHRPRQPAAPAPSARRRCGHR